MRTTLKRLLALLLGTALLATLALPASAAEKSKPANPNNCTAKNTCKHSPTIIVPGIAQSNTVLYLDGKKTDLQGGTVIPDTDALSFGTVAPVVLSLLASLFLQRDVFLSKTIYTLIKKLFWVQEMDNEGKHVQDLRTEIIGRVSDMTEAQRHTALNVYVPAQGVVDIIGEDHLFFFAFNLVGEVWDNVDRLEDYIDYVRKLTGHKKVNLVNVSLGGTLFTGYLEKYGHKKLDQVINVVSTTDGTPLLADLMTFHLNDDPAFWYDSFFPTVLETDVSIAKGYDGLLGYLVGFVFRLLPHSVASSMLRSAWQSILDTIILNCTQFWALVPRDRYKEAAKLLLSGDEHKVLKAKTDSYHKAQNNLEKNVLAAVKAGVHINNIAGAGLRFGDEEYTFFQVVASRKTANTDGIIAANGATMGATCAAPGSKLPASHKPKQAGYLSPDGSIDCSTAVLPNNTWLFLSQHHEVGRNDAVLNLIAAFFQKPGMNVKTNPKKYPQYNYAMKTHELRRWRIAEAKDLLRSGKVTGADQTALKKAIAEGEAVRKLTVGDAARAKAATDALNRLLISYGVLNAPTEITWYQQYMENMFAVASRVALYFYGANGFSQGGSVIRLWNSIRGEA